MKMGKLEIVKAQNVKFSILPRRLTLKSNPFIGHWLWFNFAADK